MARRGWGGSHAVLVVDRNQGVLAELVDVPDEELEPRILALQHKFGVDARVMVDGQHARIAPRRDDGRAAERPMGRSAEAPAIPEEGVLRFAYSLIWDTMERATDVQQHLLDQAADFTRQLIEGNRRLAEHASDLQRSYRQKLNELDYAAHTMKMMEQDAATSQVSRHIIEKSAAEIAAGRPGRSGEVLDDIIDGATTALECWVRTRAGEFSKGWTP